MTRDISEERPERECIRAIYNDISGSMKVEAAVAIVIALILVCAMVSGLVTCMGPKPNDTDEEDEKKEDGEKSTRQEQYKDKP